MRVPTFTLHKGYKYDAYHLMDHLIPFILYIYPRILELNVFFVFPEQIAQVLRDESRAYMYFTTY